MGTYNCDVRNLRIFPILPGVDYNNPPLWHPAYLAKLRGVKCLRPMDQVSAISGNATTFLDYNRPTTNLSRVVPPRRLSIKLTRFEPYAGPTIWSPYEGQPWRITTAAPHGLQDGTWVTFDYASTIGPVTYSNGEVVDVKDMYGWVKKLSDTELYFIFGRKIYDSGPPVSSTTVILNPAGHMMVELGNSMPISDIVDQCNQIGADLHLNINVAATDDCVSQLGAFLAANLKPGLKCRLAYANETWNYFGRCYNYCGQQTFSEGLGNTGNYIPYYCLQSKRIWDLFGTAYAAAGRPGDLIRLLETQWGYPGGTTGGVCDYCNSHTPRIGFDELAVAPYYENRASFTLGYAIEPGYTPLMEMMTADQLLDFYELFSIYGGWKDEVPQHRALLDQYGFADSKIIFYEGGPQYMIPPAGPSGPAIPARRGQRTHAVHRHPRFFGFMMNTFRIYQDSGCTLYNLYFLAGIESASFAVAQWSAFTGTSQLGYVPGDPAQDAIQINQFDRLDLIKSATGGAVLAWAALPLATSTPTNPPTDPPSDPPTDPPTGPPTTMTGHRNRLVIRRAGACPARIPFRPRW